MIPRLRADGHELWRWAQVSNDHFPMYEILMQRTPKPTLLSAKSYYGDVAGMEGTTALHVAVFVLLVGVVAMPAGVVLLALAEVLLRAMRLMARTGSL